MTHHKAGKIAEFLARLWLRSRGWRIVARNRTAGRGTHAGELDIVAKRGRVLAFVEVKQRRSLDKAALAVSRQQMIRNRRGAEAFLQAYPELSGLDMRFDAILVSFPFGLRHIENAY